MNKEGFTLVEMLAVIVVILLVALVAFPALNTVIKNNQQDAYNSKVNDIVLAAETYASNVGGELVQVSVKTLQEYGYISGTLTNPITNATMSGCVYRVGNSNEYREEDCSTVINLNSTTGSNYIKYTDNTLNGADPDLVAGMIPVVIANDGTVTKADLKSEWYNYSNKKWANMVLVSSTSRATYTAAAAGTTITQSDILGYFVWIPRYRYQLFNVAGNSNTTPSEIQIVFENKNTPKSTGTANGSWLTAPGFTFGTEELNGIWVGKYETTGTATAPTVLPNVSSLRSQNPSSQFITALLFTNRSLNTDGTITTNTTNTTYGIVGVDSHMAKNSEWGTVAYLVESKYGRCTSGVCTEVSINNSSSYITGSSAGKPGDSTTTASTVYAYNTTQGYLATTTGNITGIYDMSGGAWETLMTDLLDSSNKPYSGRHNVSNSGFNGSFGNLTTTTEGANNSIASLTTGYNFPDSKYYEAYGSNQLTACNGGACLGDSLSETKGWYSDEGNYITASAPWLSRSGSYSGGVGSGIFIWSDGSGEANSTASFRTILTY